MTIPRKPRFQTAAFCAAAVAQLLVPAAAQISLRATPTISLAHSTGVERLTFSPDGRQLASGGADQLAKLWDVASGRMLQSFAGMLGSVDQLMFSADGRRLVASGGRKVLKNWNTETGELLWTIDPPDDKTSALDFALTHDGQLLVDYSTPLIRRYDLHSAKRRGGVNPFAIASSEFQFASKLVLSPDEKTMALAFGRKIAIINSATGAQLVGSSRVDLQACKLEYSIVSPK